MREPHIASLATQAAISDWRMMHRIALWREATLWEAAAREIDMTGGDAHFPTQWSVWLTSEIGAVGGFDAGEGVLHCLSEAERCRAEASDHA